ncbi:MAG: hypothetical protein HYU64_19855, partial [Armatimonadetes bacterium]|nr:hypothetical protein [Armatimonadota bacterium]
MTGPGFLKNSGITVFAFLAGLLLFSGTCKNLLMQAEADCARVALDEEEYFIYVPRAYNRAKKPQQFPLLVAVHGSGLYKGKELTGGPMCEGYRRLAEYYSVILVCPTLHGDFPIAENGSGKIVERIIRQVTRKYSVHPKRISLYGFSAGAEFVERLAFMEPEMFDAVVCVDGGSDFKRTVPKNRKLPRFLFMIGAEDLPRRVRQSAEMAGIIRKAGGLAGFELIPNLGHEESEQIKRRAFGFGTEDIAQTRWANRGSAHKEEEEAVSPGNLRGKLEFVL